MFKVWTENRDHTKEGHTLTGTLKYKGKTIWGPRMCHRNTFLLGDALQEADWRFLMIFEPREKSIEGHTRYISVKDWNGKVILDKLMTHPNMDDLADKAVESASKDGPPIPREGV